MIKKYTKKPVEIEAIKWTGENTESVLSFIHPDLTPTDLFVNSSIINNYDLYIQTLEGSMKADIGDYIIKGVEGEFYPCKPRIFEKTYNRSYKYNKGETND